ncbi:MAG TPA: glucosyl-3-phosphoglycerate synthase [Actinobacteria bacterium]|nr:glucosyl-3-phosphoglycerate synthase [Actinomycetota bacterium]
MIEGEELGEAYRVLIPISKKTASQPVIEIAASLIDSHGGELIALGVVNVPPERSYSYGTMQAFGYRRLLKKLTTSELIKDVSVRSIVKVGRDTSHEIMKTAEEEKCNLIVLGWDGVHERRYFGKGLGELIDDREQKHNIVIVKPGRLRKCHNVLVPMRGGIHASLALDIAGSICRRFDAKLTIMHIFDSGEVDSAKEGQRFVDTMVREEDRQNVKLVDVASDNIAATLIKEGENYDFIIVGSSILDSDRRELGPVPKALARKSKATVMIVKSREPDPSSLFEPYRIEEFPDWKREAEELPEFVDKWFAENTFDRSEFEPVEELVELKKKKGLTISLGLPALNEEKTVGKVIEVIKGSLMDDHQLLDEMVLIDSCSTDKTPQIAESLGVPVVQHSDTLPAHGSFHGKGEALWKSLYVLNGDIIVWIDTDIRNITPEFVYGLVGPILHNPQIQYVKGFYHRPLTVNGGLEKTGGGRVTELTARPLINLFFPALSGLVQPLSGEYAGTRGLLEQLVFYTGYGVEISLLIDILHKFGLPVIGQVDLEQRIHRNQSLESLSKMSFAIIQATMESLEQRHKVKLLQQINRRMNLIRREDKNFHLLSEEIYDQKRPPMLMIPEYQEKFITRVRGEKEKPLK